MPIDIEAIVDSPRYWIMLVRWRLHPVPKEPALREMRVGALYERLRGTKQPYEFKQDELFSLLSTISADITKSAYGFNRPRYQPISHEQFERRRGRSQPPLLITDRRRIIGHRQARPLGQEEERELDALEKRQSTPEGFMELAKEHYERQDAEFNEITRLRQTAMRCLLEDENLLVEAEIGGDRQFVSDWKLEELAREQGQGAAEVSAKGGENNSEPEALASAATEAQADIDARPPTIDEIAAHISPVRAKRGSAAGYQQAVHHLEKHPQIPGRPRAELPKEDTRKILIKADFTGIPIGLRDARKKGADREKHGLTCYYCEL